MMEIIKVNMRRFFKKFAWRRTAKVVEYYYYKRDEPLSCWHCGWSGIQTETGELYHDLFEVNCPRCWTILVVVELPTLRQTKEAAQQGNKEAIEAMANWPRD